MISDEMREQLSAYVDGELRDADAARVEEVSKRDPELRREIEAYRTLRRKLREWDTAEHGGEPASTLTARVLARARTMDAALATRGRSPVWGAFAIAASLLLAVGVGYGIARFTAPEPPALPEPGPGLVLANLDPAPDVALKGSSLVPAKPSVPTTVSGMRISDHIPSRRALLELEQTMRRQDLVRANPEPESEPERRTETPISTEIRKMVSGYAPGGDAGALVVISSAPGSMLEPIGAATGRARDPSEGRIMPRLPEKGPSVVAPLGEVWMGVDGGGHARIVSETEWVQRNASVLLPVVWGDSVGTQKTTPDVEVQEFILGPKARRQLLKAAPGLDATFLAWLRKSYGERPLPELFAEGAKDRERALKELMDVLNRDKSATGFAVFSRKGDLLGTELFYSHEVMLAFAPRLLRGYLFEAGEDGVLVAAPRAAGSGREAVQNLLEGMPGQGLRVDSEALDVPFSDGLGTERQTMRAPRGVARVTLRTSAGEAVGHGLVHQGTPIHLTLFGE